MDKEWTEMTPAEKREARFKKWSAAEGVKFESPDAEAAYKKAIERFRDISLLGEDPGQGAGDGPGHLHADGPL